MQQIEIVLENGIKQMKIDVTMDKFVDKYNDNVTLPLSDQTALENFEEKLSQREQFFSDFVSYIILIKQLNPFLRQ